MKVLEPRGIPGYHASQAFYKYVLALKMQPAHFGEDFKAFSDRLDGMTTEDQQSLIRQAITLLKLEYAEIYDLCQFVTDDNGVPYTAENMRKLTPRQIQDILEAISFKIASDFDLRFLSDAEKKNSIISQST